MDALKKELAEAFTDEDYVSSLTDVLCEQLIKSFKKTVRAEIDELRRKILKNKGKIIAGGVIAAALMLMRRK